MRSPPASALYNNTLAVVRVREVDLKLSELKKILPDATFMNFSDVKIEGIADDSRQVQKSWLFVAVRGVKADGHKYVGEAVAAGATAIVAEEKCASAGGLPQIVVPNSRLAVAAVGAAFYGHASEQLTVSATTGTDGKSSITLIGAAIARAAGRRTGVIGTIAYQIGDRRLPANETTPGALSLQSLLADMRVDGVEMVFMEASSHGLDQDRLHGVKLASAVHSVVSADHLDYHVSPEAYREAKAKLFRGLEPSASAVLNADDDAYGLFRSATRANVVSYSLESQGEYRAEIVETTLEGVEFKLQTPNGSVPIRSGLVGRHNVQNCLAAAANAHVLGIDLPTIKAGIESIDVIPGRLERVSQPGDPVVLIDYGHTAHALKSVLRALRNLKPHRIIAVFGCGGDRDRGKRPEMGNVAATMADVVWITSDNPRSESPEAIIEDILGGIQDAGHCRVEADRRNAIEGAIAEARPGDIVLVAGKGHEAQQIFKDHVIPFRDSDVARRVLKARRQTQMVGV